MNETGRKSFDGCLRATARLYALASGRLRWPVRCMDLILPELNHRLRVYAQRKIEQRGIELITGARVEGVDEGVVSLSTGRHIHTSTLIWTAGTASNPLIASLGLPTRSGRVVVD